MTRGRRRAALGAALLLATVLLPAAGPGPAAVAAQCVPPGKTIATLPWAQQRYPLEQIWRLATGAGAYVAVAGSGVDGAQPQLAGAVLGGREFRGKGRGPASGDCTGLGTHVAGIVAARKTDGVGFAGVAPGAAIVPLGVSDVESLDSGGGDRPGTPALLATALKAAADAHIGIIVIPLVTHQNDPALRSAVAYAIAHDVVVIAEIGPAPDSGPSIPYPAAYDGVVGVGPVDEQGSLPAKSPSSKYVDLVAPGAGQLISTQPRGGMTPVEGSGIAAGYVAATAALIRSRWPAYGASEVIRRLEATATPAAGGPGTPGYGYGMVNPLQAVTETMAPSGTPSKVAPYRAAVPDRATLRQDAAESDGKRRALIMAGAGSVAVLAVIVFAVALPLGRKRRWRPGMAAPLPEHPEDDLPSPPMPLFEEHGA